MAKTCNSCGTESQHVNVPYVVHESAVARQERQIKRMWIALIVAVALIFASNAIWLYAWMQYDYESYEAITDNGVDANIIGNDGDIYNGYGEVETKR